MFTVSLLTSIGVLVVVKLHSEKQDKSSKRNVSALIRALGAILWPMVLLSVTTRRNRLKPALIIPLAWGLLVYACNHYFDSRACPTSTGEETSAVISINPSTVAGIMFGMCGIVGAKDSEHMHMFVTALIGVVAVVLPSHNLKTGCYEAVVLDEIQRVVLQWCVGLLLAGVSLVSTAPCKRAY